MIEIIYNKKNIDDFDIIFLIKKYKLKTLNDIIDIIGIDKLYSYYNSYIFLKEMLINFEMYISTMINDHYINDKQYKNIQELFPLLSQKELRGILVDSLEKYYYRSIVYLMYIII